MDRADDIIIRKLRSHSDIDDDDAQAITKLSKTPRLSSARQDLVCEGDKPEVSIIVLKGMLARYMTVGHDRQYISFHIAGDWPDAQTLFIERMDHAVCALDDALVVFVPHAELISLFEKRPAVGFAIWRETLIDAAIFREAITRIGARPVTERIAHLFCELYYRSRAAGLAKLGSCPLPISQGQLARTLGISIVTANRAIQKLRATEMMDYRDGELRITNWEGLAAFAHFDSSYLSLVKRPRL